MQINKRKRKMLLMLPLLVIPFLTMAFWALGGGSGNEDESDQTTRGLNLDLPDANLKEDNPMDKLGFYDKADKDSMKLEEWMRNDPYYNQQIDPEEMQQPDTNNIPAFNPQLNTTPYEIRHGNPEQKIMARLAQLENEMNKTPILSQEVEATYPLNNDVSRLELMMKNVNEENGDAPEMQQLNGTLDKILDIQHPQRIQDRLKERSLQNKQQVFAVSTEREGDTLVSGFHSLRKEDTSINQNAIAAVVHEAQTLVNGAVIKLRLLTDIYIIGSLIPKGNFVFGIAFLNNERLEVEINSIRHDRSLYPVKLEVYDMDGLPGIYIPGAISRDVAKQSADNSLQLMELSSMDPSLKAQAASAGVGAVKSLLSKKVKLIKVMVKAGYRVLLKDKNVQH